MTLVLLMKKESGQELYMLKESQKQLYISSLDMFDLRPMVVLSAWRTTDRSGPSDRGRNTGYPREPVWRQPMARLGFGGGRRKKTDRRDGHLE